MRKLAVFVWALLASVGTTSTAHAIVIGDPATAGYATGNGAFTGVAKVTFTSGGTTFLCSGALLIDGLHVVTAGHCVNGGADWQVTFETPGGTTTLAAVAAALHPLFAARPAPEDHLNEYDIAILTLAGLAPADAARYGIADDLPAPGTPVDLVGYGLGGSPDGNLGAGVRRHAVNTIDGAVATYDGVPSPDLPLVMSALFGSDGAGDGLIAPGDSGGPALLGAAIVGIGTTSSVFNPPNLSEGVTYVTSHANLTNDAIGGWLLAFVQVGEPAATLPFAAGTLLLLAVSSRRRRPRSRS